MSPSRGFLNPSADDWNTLFVVVAFCSIALYNFIELNTIIYTTFKRRSGLYFWSFLISTNGIAPYAIGFLLKDLRLSHSQYLDLTLIVIGWVCLVTGQAFVLYSRLHLVLRDRHMLRLVLAMIIVNAVICHVPTTVLVYGANTPGFDNWIWPYSVYEKVEVTLFFVQEMIISCTYIYKTISFFRLESSLYGKTVNRLMMQLIWINILIMVLDTTILALEYANFYNIQTAVKGMVYSIKLKLEFRVLNGMIELTKAGNQTWIGRQGPCMNPCCCAGGQHSDRGGDGGISGGIYDGTDPRSATVDFEMFNETMISRAREGAKSERAESAYEVRIFSDGGEAVGESSQVGGITIRTETEVSTMRVEEWEAATAIWPGLEVLGVDAATSRPATRGSRPVSMRHSSEIEFATG